MDDAMEYGRVIDIAENIEPGMTVRVKTTTGFEWAGFVEANEIHGLHLQWMAVDDPPDDPVGETYVPSLVMVWHHMGDENYYPVDGTVEVCRYWVDRRELMGEDGGESEFIYDGVVSELEIVDRR